MNIFLKSIKKCNSSILILSLFIAFLLSSCSDAFRQPENDNALSTLLQKEKKITFNPNWQMAFSDKQGFSIHLPKGYLLHSEEYGRDIILSTDKEKSFMRVEVLPDSTTDIVALKEESLNILNTDKRTYYPLSKTTLKNIPIKNLNGWQTVKKNQQQLTLLIYSARQRQIRISIFEADPQQQVLWLRMVTSIIPYGRTLDKENP